jgi:nicotinamidase-related amidase
VNYDPPATAILLVDPYNDFISEGGQLGSAKAQVFANTDLDLQLKQHGIRAIVMTGMIANTCLESTGRFGMELGYHVTLVTDATAAFSQEAMHAAHAIYGPTYAHAIVTTDELIAQLVAANDVGSGAPPH